MTTIERVEGMSLDEFMRLYNQEGPFELISGERLSLSPNVLGHNIILQILFLALYNYCQPKQLGTVLTEAPFVLSDNTEWVRGARVPDLMFIRAERWGAYTASNSQWMNKPLLLVPDLAVEIVSPTDLFTQVSRKVAQYLADGVQIVWVINPRQNMVIVHVAGSDQQTTLTVDRTLDGGDVIPGFTLSVAELFKELS